MKWYEKILIESKKEIVQSAIVSLVATLIFSLWYFATGNGFKWKEIDPLSAPLWYPFYSALVFIGPGAYLYYFTDFYRNLYHLFRKVFWAPNLHKNIKAAMWLSMAAIVFFIVKIVIDFLNAVISFIYNITILILYIFPIPGVFSFIFVSSYLFLLKRKRA